MKTMKPNYKAPVYKKILLIICILLIIGILILIIPFAIKLIKEKNTRLSNYHSFNNTNDTSTQTATIATEPDKSYTNLKDLTVSESEGYFSDENAAIDSVGNKYSNNFVTLGSTGVSGNGTSYATFYLGGKYKTLSGNIAVNSSSWDEYTASFSIYCDDNEVYTTGEASKIFAPTEIQINIENCQWIKFNVNNFSSFGGEHVNFILSEFCLFEDDYDYSASPTTYDNAVVNDIYLKDIVPSESDDYFQDTNAAKDSYGNPYDNHIVTIGGVGGLENGTSYATFYLGNKYKTITGKIAVNETGWDNKVASLIIYSNEEEVFNTGDVGKEYTPSEITLNVENCEWLKVFVDNNDGEWGENINFILSEMRLHT